MEEGIRTGQSKKGRSGAQIIFAGSKVIKIGKNLKDQYEQCFVLYPVTPYVEEYVTIQEGDGVNPELGLYIMERLDEPERLSETYFTAPVDMLCTMRATLETVWRQRLANTARYDYMDWESKLKEFCASKGVYVGSLINSLKLDEIMAGVPYPIHGDPTLANVLMRNNPAVSGAVPTSKSLVICDPIAPGGKIPAHYTVDIGKMLQSAIGWETVIYGLHIPREECIAAALGVRGRQPSLQEVQRAWFWCMVHLLRILPYVAAGSVTYVWAMTHAQAIYKDLKADKVLDPCYMPLI